MFTPCPVCLSCPCMQTVKYRKICVNIHFNQNFEKFGIVKIDYHSIKEHLKLVAEKGCGVFSLANFCLRRRCRSLFLFGSLLRPVESFFVFCIGCQFIGKVFGNGGPAIIAFISYLDCFYPLLHNVGAFFKLSFRAVDSVIVE